jgi:hypothetical protein
MSSPWTREEASASGQVFEFRLWAALAEQSRGALHVFLPLADRGIDALVHRLIDDTFLAVQAKGRSVLVEGEVRLEVWADSLHDDKALLVSGLLTDGGLGPTMLVVPVGDFKRMATSSLADGRPIFSTTYATTPSSSSRWHPFLVATDELVERFGIGQATLEAAPITEPSPTWRSDLGFLGESELVRLLAEGSDLNPFRPFPDLETSEVGVLNLQSRQVLGLQAKTVGVDRAHPSATVSVLASSFRPSPNTQFVILAWLREEGEFHEECLLIPSEALRSVCQPGESYGHLKFEWDPGSSSPERLEPYRRMRSEIRSAIEDLTGGRSGW